uniref:Transmembrane protein 14A n=1 Tax=Canis lupus familiaris TaxID=9615 RepID=A0A8P0T325_CANLF
MGRRRPAECQAGSANERAPAQVAPPSPPRLEPPSGRWGLGQSPPPRPRRGRASRPPGIRGIHRPRGVCPGGREQVRARSPWEPPAPGGEPTGATPESESPAGTRGPPTGAGTAPGRPEDGPGMNCGKNQEDSSFRIATLPMDLIGFGYAALVTFGSILGYKRRGGLPSLIAGLFVGFLAGYGAYRVSNDKRDVKLSLFTAFFLATIMGVRYKRSKKIMPAGLVAGLSLMMILRLVLLLL